MESFIFSVSAVAPIVLMVLIGYFLKSIGMMKEQFAKDANKLVFRVFMPVMLFLNIYKIKDLSGFDFGFIGYVLIALLIIFVVSIPAVIAVTKDKGRRGVLVQAAFRSGYSLIGIPLAESLYGTEGAIAATLLSAGVIPLFNILAVIKEYVITSSLHAHFASHVSCNGSTDSFAVYKEQIVLLNFAQNGFHYAFISSSFRTLVIIHTHNTGQAFNSFLGHSFNFFFFHISQNSARTFAHSTTIAGFHRQVQHRHVTGVFDYFQRIITEIFVRQNRVAKGQPHISQTTYGFNVITTVVHNDCQLANIFFTCRRADNFITSISEISIIEEINSIGDELFRLTTCFGRNTQF